MKTIIAANENVMKILRKPRISEHGYRMIKYCIPVQTEDGILLFNTLTRELLLLTEEEYNNHLDLEDLRTKWFVVPNDLNEKEFVLLARMVLKSIEQEKEITSYTILTTMDCNARCFYCYELGRNRTPMSEETAQKLPAFIAKRSGGKPVKIAWFGGEPLYNAKVIDIICSGLQELGISYTSSMVSNAYLLDETMVKKAKDLWNLKNVQITLDGTEDVYNRSKAFIYKEGSAYQIVMHNIGVVLDAGIRVNIRLNMDLKNAENLLELVDELAARFGSRKDLGVYARLIFDDALPMYERYQPETLDKLYEALQKIQAKIRCNDLVMHGRSRLNRNLKIKHCMADSGNSLVITPAGKLTLCEHHTEDEIIGDINSETWDKAVIDSWRELIPEVPECNDCPIFPECSKLKKCSNQELCYEQLRLSRLRGIRNAILAEYAASKKEA